MQLSTIFLAFFIMICLFSSMMTQKAASDKEIQELQNRADALQSEVTVLLRSIETLEQEQQDAVH